MHMNRGGRPPHPQGGGGVTHAKYYSLLRCDSLCCKSGASMFQVLFWQVPVYVEDQFGTSMI